MKLELADPLVEKAVRLALAGGPEEAVYHREREEIYDIEDAEDREAAFRALHRRWFLASNLEECFWEALAEVPGVRDAVARWCVSEASRASQEGAELYVSPLLPPEGTDDGTDVPPRERRVLVLRLLPATLVERSGLFWLLRRELLHIADMVDPAFEYQPRLPPSAVGPVHDDLLRKRYAVLWSTSVLGRLEQQGQAPGGVTDAARRRFSSAFPMFGEKAEEIFERLFRGQRPSHGEFVKLAREPRETAGLTPGAGIQCPVCGSPTYVCETRDSLEDEVVACLRAERPQWRSEQGLCPRCADLYRVRSGVFGQVRGGESPSVALE